MNPILIAIFGYVALLLGISLWHKKKNYHANEDFLIADRKLSGWVASFTIIASFIGGGTLLGNTSLIFKFGQAIFPLLIMLPVGLLFFMLIAPQVNRLAKKENWLTLYDMFESRFGRETKNIIAIIQLVNILLIASVAMIGGAKMIEMFTAYSYEMCVILMASIVGGYLSISGFSAVVKTDIIQAIFLLVIFGVLLAFLLMKETSETIAHTPLIFDSMPIYISVFMAVIGGLVSFGSEDLYQRVYATSNVKEVKKSLWITFFMWSFCYVCLVGAVFKLKTFFPNLTGDMAFLDGIHQIIPQNLNWLASLAILSVLLSTIDTFVFNGVLNFNKLFFEEHDKQNHRILTRRIKRSIPIFLFVIIMISVFIQSVVHTTYIYGMLMAENGLIAIIAFAFPKANKWYAIFPLVLNIFAGVLLVSILGFSEKLAVLPLITTPIGCLIAYGYNIIKKTR
ncbi:MAG: hypothetical protein JXR30_01950 [Alphaproteobacteria bacterium]|nr:hypothetical protein [Alphaproteobacteria bacterium]